MSNSPTTTPEQVAPKTKSKKPAAKDKVAEIAAQPVAKRPVKTKSSKSVTTAAKPVAIKEKPAKEVKDKKAATKRPKLVRDSFTFPATDYALIGTLKQRVLNAGREIKKSEVLRAGLAVLSALTDAALLKTLDGLARLETGRQSK